LWRQFCSNQDVVRSTKRPRNCFDGIVVSYARPNTHIICDMHLVAMTFLCKIDIIIWDKMITCTKTVVTMFSPNTLFVLGYEDKVASSPVSCLPTDISPDTHFQPLNLPTAMSIWLTKHSLTLYISSNWAGPPTSNLISSHSTNEQYNYVCSNLTYYCI
jgi:hypothetical protein